MSRAPAAMAAGASYLVVKNLLMDLEMADFWPSQPGDFKNQHLQPRQQVSKNHIIDGPPCNFEFLAQIPRYFLKMCYEIGKNDCQFRTQN